MKIVTWNVKGLGNLKKNTSVKATFRKCGPDIVMIQETKKEFSDSKLLRSIWGIYNCEWTSIPSIGAACGLMIAWKTNFFNFGIKRIWILFSFGELKGIIDGQLWWIK